MSVSITTSSVADLTRIGWNKTEELLRAGHLPANKVVFLDAVIAEIVADQGGTANTSNVTAALSKANSATPEAAIITVAAL